LEKNRGKNWGKGGRTLTNLGPSKHSGENERGPPSFPGGLTNKGGCGKGKKKGEKGVKGVGGGEGREARVKEKEKAFSFGGGK